MAKIHRISAPENDSETKAIRSLAQALPASYEIFHNFELTTGRGLPYEYDIAVVGDFAVWHVEVKGYRGRIKGDRLQWQFENGYVQPSPIPLANKKSKILAGKLRNYRKSLRNVWVDTAILLTDDYASIDLRDDQAARVIQLRDALRHFTDQNRLPVATDPIDRLHDPISKALFGGARPCKKIRSIGLYDIIERINQTDTRTVFLASHRHISTRPKTILKVYHFDVYSTEQDREAQIQAIFHDQNVMRLLGAHPNLIATSDMFPWGDDKFVLPTEFIEKGRPLEVLLAKEEDRELSWGDKSEIITKMARGLRHAHGHGVIHRDIRPLNVVVAPDGTVKLVNFDLALILDSPHLQPGDDERLQQRLDRRYVAPEVWKSPGAATPVSDIYSLGILFYQLVTGETPYGDIEEVVDSGKPTPLDLDLLMRELSTPGSEDFMRSPEDGAAVIRRMVQQDPGQRYQAMDEVCEDLMILRDD
ncbi:MAG: protein kinase [Planctomycetes bacterium]|nr:protein kinase [Planctomycetota bacterium]MCB9889592.1 protein kinase [Planctomycetota bacterium]